MFIAEIGINHNGNIEIARSLISMAKRAGADVVKFQKRSADASVPISMRDVMRQTPWGEMSYMEYRRKLEFGRKEYEIIDSYCRYLGIEWSASVWDIKSLEFILQYNIPFIKIPSACITDMCLLSRVRRSKKPVIISTGMSTLSEIKLAVKMLSGTDLTILHCNSSYPNKDNEINLNVIKTLKKMFLKHKVGYSGHEEGINASLLAGAFGAEVIERHITLDKTMWGSDQKFSLDERELTELICGLKQIPVWMGKYKIQVHDSELEARMRLRRI